jgi:N-acetylmuramoyl-L-alanine amidase
MWPKNIILHHSLTRDNETVSWDAIRRYHTATLGFRAIGYHYGIELVNNRYEILLGRMWYEVGAHCKDEGMNNKSLGICFVGNFDLNRIPKAQWLLGIQLVSSLCMLHSISVTSIYGHKNFSVKTCPGKLFNIDLFREDVKKLIFDQSRFL